MSLQEATPAEPCSPQCGRYTVAAEQVADARQGDPMAERQELASDALITPKWVLPGQPQDQLAALSMWRRV